MRYTATRIIFFIPLVIVFQIAGAQVASFHVINGNPKDVLGINLQTDKKPRGLHGKVQDQNENGVPFAVITNLTTGNVSVTNIKGEFYMDSVSPGNKLRVTGDNVATREVKTDTRRSIIINVVCTLVSFVDILLVNTGYQLTRKRTHSTANFVVSQEVLQQRSSPNIYDRLEGLVPGLLPVTEKERLLHQPTYFSIGARNTMLGDPDPLIILNNFEFKGRLENINPDNIDYITFLRDASAAGIWGARAANGVIVITTKTSRCLSPLRVSFNTALSLGTRPDLFYKDRMSSADRIYVDSVLFKNGYFDQFGSRTRVVLSPVVEALYDKNRTDADREALFNAWRAVDNRYEQQKSFYRSRLNQHHFVEMAAGSNANNFYFSMGYDHTLPELRLSQEERKTLLADNNLRLTHGLEFGQSFSFTENWRRNIGGVPEIPAPYEMLVDADTAAAYPFLRRSTYIDTAGRGKLLDWKYYPLKEFQLRNRIFRDMETRMQATLKYNNFKGVFKGLEAALIVQQQINISEMRNFLDQNSFYVRDLINSYSQINSNEVYRPILPGHILDLNSSSYKTLNTRFRLSYLTKKEDHTISILAGADYSSMKGALSSSRIYGIREGFPAGQQDLDYAVLYPMYYAAGSRARIPNLNHTNSTTENYWSQYLNVNVKWRGRYDFLGSVRLDKSSLYGPNAKDKTIPLLSAGAGWELSAERFYQINWMPYVKLRMVYGGSGNAMGNTTAIQRISYSGYNYNGDPIANINNTPVNSLKWEKTNTLNLGLNLCTVNNRIVATIDWYHKTARDLIGYRALDPTTGNSFLTGNVGSMASRNVDLLIETRNIWRQFQWQTSFMLSHVKDYVKHTEDTLNEAWKYCDPMYFTTVSDKPLYSIFSFTSYGLDAVGNPLTVNKNTDYSSIINKRGYESLRYHGRATPQIFGSLTNKVNWKQLSMVVNLVYKLNYYFRRPSINYSALYNGTSAGSSDFERRWKQSGDEYFTYVPSMPLKLDVNRDYFYNYSQLLVERGDHIRLQNFYMSYDLERNVLKKLHLRNANFYFNWSNIVIIWRANKYNIDPDRLLSYPQPVTFTVGFKGTFK